MATRTATSSLAYGAATLGPAKCGADISNGSERGEYVPMSRVFAALSRPHRAVNIMFTYYPLDEEWPARIEDLHPWKPGMGVWQTPYDNYFPLTGMGEGDHSTQVYEQIRDIRRAGSDVHLTLTADCKTPSSKLRAIARDLAPFGRLFFRINHECNGVWFQHNQRYSYKQVSAFFCRFHDIVKEEAPLVQTVMCLNGMPTREEMKLGENELADAVRVADVIGIDRYISLFHGFPHPWTNDPATYYSDTMEEWWRMMRLGTEMVHEVRGDRCRITLPEINADADCDGLRGQAKRVAQIYDHITTETYPSVSAATYYHYRDQGGLGLEREDPVRRTYAGTQPVMAAYKRAIADPHFLPSVKLKGASAAARTKRGLKWHHSEKAEGVSVKGTVPRSIKKPVLTFDEAPAIVWCDGVWRFVEDGRLDLTKLVKPGAKFQAAVFFTPRGGANSRSGDAWLDHYLHPLRALPEISAG